MRVPANGNLHLRVTDVWSNGDGADGSRQSKSAQCSSHTKIDYDLSVYRIAILLSFIIAFLLLIALLREASRRPESTDYCVAHFLLRIIHGFSIAIIFTVCVCNAFGRLWRRGAEGILLFPFFPNLYSPFNCCRRASVPLVLLFLLLPSDIKMKIK